MGVSNTAGTLNFINDMKYIIKGFLVLLLIYCCHIFIKSSTKLAITSSPVEEMYHRQLVTTIDSILDARFGSGCYEEDIDTVNANTFRTRFGDILSPME